MTRLAATTLVALGLLASRPAIATEAATARSAQPQTRNSKLETSTHWAFIAPCLPPVPSVKNKRWVRNPIDGFVLAKLESEHFDPSPEADRITLLRRLSLDLLGLPPTPEQARAFVADRRPDAYEQLVDSLLASPHFGERWARHWLDLARYADTSGYQVDRTRPFAYLFRDWVIDAINNDMRFDQFTIEQLAGDLLPNATTEQKTAAGFHRLTLMNHEDGVDAEEFRCKAKVDRVSTTATVWLGLTVGCAECHNHKFDPITQREFYQLYAFFNNSDEIEVPISQSPPAQYDREKKLWEEEQARLKESFAQLTKANDPRAAEVRKQLTRHKKSRPKTAEIQAPSFQEKTNAAGAFIHVRGDFLRRGSEVCPGTPAVLHPFCSREKPDRLDLARWIVDPANPLTARVTVNHAWQHLFGRALVNTPEDFGTRGEPPSHPDLLDWLAVTFASSTNTQHATPETPPTAAQLPPALAWSRKALIRLIVTSSTYRQSSHFRPGLIDRDPQNTLLSHQNRFRVEAEIVRDLCLSAGGLLNDEVGGPSFHPYVSDAVKKLGTAGAFSWEDSPAPEKYRRGLYIFAQRTVPYPTSMTFDQADPNQSCTRRERSDTPLQALTLLNHGLFVECAQGLARRLMDLPTKEPRARIELGFEVCLSRKPAKEELTRLEELYAAELRLARSTPDASARLVSEIKPAPADPAEAASLIALSQILLNLDEFMTRE